MSDRDELAARRERRRTARGLPTPEQYASLVLSLSAAERAEHVTILRELHAARAAGEVLPFGCDARVTLPAR